MRELLKLAAFLVVVCVACLAILTGCASTYSEVQWGEFRHTIQSDRIGQESDIGFVYERPTTGTIIIRLNVSTSPEPGITMINNATGEVMKPARWIP